MPMQLDTGAIKAESRSLLRTGEVNPFRMTLFYLLITLVLDMINSGVSYMIDSAGGFTVLSFSFVSILVGLVALVAMMPLITVQVMGAIYVVKSRHASQEPQLPDFGDNEIIELWEAC